ncbi:MAG: hypothetical protein HQK65_23145 [Desulfamplus sp.]|nr:hypothetical protein [Desulfamplus sp.]
MPVAQLLCEGGNNSPDVRVLSKLLSGICEIKPLGGKYGMGAKIIARREAFGQNSVYGILDGDFLKDWVIPSDHPKEWKRNDGAIHFGWRWERKEIENYLIDPIVVERALGENLPDIHQYRTELELAKENISIYQAARTALSANRIRFRDVPSAFGPKRGKEKHPFPDVLDKDGCAAGIREIIDQHQENQLVPLEDVTSSFEALLLECVNGGIRNQHYLHAFAGKDLFWSMNQWFIDNGFKGAWVFREKVLSGIQKTTDDISTWLPEWDELRDAINSI